MRRSASTFAARDRRRHELAELARSLPKQAELLEATLDVLSADVGFDAMFVAATDPMTTLFAGAGVVGGLPPDTCHPWLENEFAVDDFMKFRDLHRSGSGATTLHRVTHGRPSRSHRYREVHTPVGLGPELRATFEVGGECWGALSLLRTDGAQDFDDDALATVDAVAEVVARGLRAGVLREGLGDPEEATLGVVVLDPNDAVLSVSDTARRLFRQLGHPTFVHDGTRLPGEIHVVAARARARASGFHGADAMLRLRGTGGTWLTVRAECTRDRTGAVATTVVVLQPAPFTAVLPLLVSAYELTEREETVLGQLVRGATTDEVARSLSISPHTVRDHVKSLFTKVGVRSRGELVSALYGLHLAPGLEVEHVGG